MTTIPNICMWGSRLWIKPPGMTCEAFLPCHRAAILDIAHDHRRPYPRDHGLLFTGEWGNMAFVSLEVSHERL